MLEKETKNKKEALKQDRKKSKKRNKRNEKITTRIRRTKIQRNSKNNNRRTLKHGLSYLNIKNKSLIVYVIIHY